MRSATLCLASLFCACASGAPPAQTAPLAQSAPVAQTAPVAQPVCPPPQERARAPITSDRDSTLYALGLVMGQRLGDFSLTSEELEVVQRGVTDQVTNAPRAVELRRWGERINEMAHERIAARLTQERERGRVYGEQAEREPGARRMPSGLIIRELRAGTGQRPGARDVVRVNYRGTLIDGSEFDSSYDAGGNSQPVEFPLDGVIRCWQEGITLMTVGSRAVLVCPAEIAYGERGQRGIPPGATLTFEVELLATREPEAMPPQMRAMPADAGAPTRRPAPRR